MDGVVLKMRFRGPEFNLKTMRYLMLMITTKFMILACVMIAFGFGTYSYFHSLSFFEEGIKSGKFFTPALITLLIGVILLVVTLFGLIGTLRESTCLVNVYALILSLLLILKLVVVILAFSLDYSTVRNALYIPISRYVTDLEIEMEIDHLQKNLNCCGSESYFDYVGLAFTDHHHTTKVFLAYEDKYVVIPATCCAVERLHECLSVRTMGCKSALIATFMRHSGVIGILGICVTIMKVLGVVFSLMLARCIRKAKSERGLRSWTITERTILARRNNPENQGGDQTGDQSSDQSSNQSGDQSGHQTENQQANPTDKTKDQAPTAPKFVVVQRTTICRRNNNVP